MIRNCADFECFDFLKLMLKHYDKVCSIVSEDELKQIIGN